MDDNHPLPVPRTDHQRESSSRRTSSVQRQSFDTGESSATGSNQDEISNEHSILSSDVSPGGPHHSGTISNLPGREVRSRRKGRQPSNNTFLLHDAVAAVQERSNRRQSRNVMQQGANALPRTPERGELATASAKASSLTPEGPPRLTGKTSGGLSEGMSRRTTLEETRPSSSEHATSSPVQAQAVDVDSTQIVNMALNLSESRRIASTRRNVSRTHPPGLVPLPDISQGGSLRQHLQQQRKSSRGGSPRPAQPSSPRVPYSTVRTSSPLQSTGLEAGQEASYRWHFTPSTLARAQKAKEQLELMAQYRRLLEFLPPLTPAHGRTLTSPPLTLASGARASNSSSQRSAASQGRPYNPLQYIRNRKVRARERKVIDGEGQGFADVEAVKAWVNAIADKSSSSSPLSINTANCPMPAFPGITECDSQSSPESAAKAAARTRRPRVDWFFDPCDMVADAYWLEQDHHKHLIEDRHRRKIFPLSPDMIRPQSKQGDVLNATATPYSIKTLADAEIHYDPPAARQSKINEDSAQARTREETRMRLHDMKGLHHRHNSSLSGPQDALRFRRQSFSDFSESENEGKDGLRHLSRRSRAGTLSSDSNDLLHKQMLEILAKEARENGQEVPETVFEQDEPEEGLPVAQSVSSNAASRTHSRKGSTANAVDAGKRPPGGRGHSPRRHRLGQFSLDFGDRLRHYSTDDDSSAPVSPQHEKTEQGMLSLGNATLSPSWSRSGSPIRNRLIKPVTAHHDKEKIGRSLEPPEALQPDEANDKRDRRASITGANHLQGPTSTGDSRQTSPGRQLQPLSAHESHKGHRGTNSVKPRDDQSSSLRGIFKGPRIDNVLRGGVSKLGDILWRKDDAPPETAESTDESESEIARGRLRQTLSRQPSKRKDGQRRPSKHFLDAMPQFHPIADSRQHVRAESTSKGDGQPSRSHSRQSSRFQLLKPPDIDAKRRSSSVSPPAVPSGTQPSDSDVSEAAIKTPRISDGVRAADRRLSSIMGIPQFPEASRSASQSWLQGDIRPAAPRGQLTKREVARMKALILSSGIKAMEISRRANSRTTPLDSALAPTESSSIPWTAIAQLSPDPSELYSHAYTRCDLYPLAARHLSSTIQNSAQRWQSSVDRFTSSTAPTLHRRLGTLRSRLADDLSEKTREASDMADETGKDLALTQPLRIKHVQDLVEKLMRRRRRRFRWTRRAMWLGVEWVLVGFMWYVWFVVTFLRLVLGIGKGVWAGVRWLLWL